MNNTDERMYDPRPYDSRYNRDYFDRRADRYDDGGRDYDRSRGRSDDYDRYEKRFDERRYCHSHRSFSEAAFESVCS